MKKTMFPWKSVVFSVIFVAISFIIFLGFYEFPVSYEIIKKDIVVKK